MTSPTKRRGTRRSTLLILLSATSSVVCAAQENAVRWAQVNSQPAAWYGTPEALSIADSILKFQTASGGWPKNVDMTQPPNETFLASKAMDVREPNIDNGATYTQVRYLAKVISEVERSAVRQNPNALSSYRTACFRGFDYLLAAQYPNGGWPQYFPLHEGYYTHITFNDDTMVNVMTLLRDAGAGREPFAFVDAARRAKATAAVAKGLECILKCQVTVAGVKTAWCAQHDEKTYAPAKARAYEHISLSGSETVGIVRYLMSIENPGADVVSAVNAAVAWLDKVKLTGIRYGADRVVRPDPAAPALWARFYELGTNRPIFSGRDSIVRYDVAEIEAERRNGYTWYGTWPQALITRDYPEWVKKLAPLALIGSEAKALFDGTTFAGWQSRPGIWRIENGALTAGELETRFPRNEFIATTRPYANFVLYVEVRLLGIDGFVNGGVQLRSTWHPTQPNEMYGYQADIGNGYTGSLYDESRRNRTLVSPDPALISRIEKLGDWNTYDIRCEGPRIRISLNGTQTVDYTETDPAIPLTGLIALQIHGGATSLIAYRNIRIEELPGPEPAPVTPVSTDPLPAGRGGAAPAAGRGGIPRILPNQMGALMPLLVELNALQTPVTAARTELAQASLALPRDDRAIASKSQALAAAEQSAASARAAAFSRLQSSANRLSADQLPAFTALVPR